MRWTRVRWQCAVVGKARKPGSNRRGCHSPLAVHEKVPAPEEHSGAQVEPQTPSFAACGKSYRRAGHARFGEHDIGFGLGQEFAQKTRRIALAPANSPRHGGDLPQHSGGNLRGVALRLGVRIRVQTLDTDAFLQKSKKL